MRTRFHFFASILFGSLAISGCSSSGSSSWLAPMESSSPIYTGVAENAAESLQALQSAKVCCDRLDQIRYQPLETNKTRYYEFNAQSPAFEFATGKSFVQAFEIPANLDRATITIDAIAGKTVFVPTVLILNDRFQATRAVDSSRFRYTPASFMEPQRLTGDFYIDRTRSGSLAKDRYFLVFTTDRDLDGSTQMISELRLYRRAHALADPATPNPVAQHAASGVIRLKTSDLELASRPAGSYVSEQDSARRYVEPVATIPQGKETAPAPLAPSKPAPGQGQQPMLSETQALYDRMIREAVANGDMDRAWRLVGEAERAGSSSARRTFVEAVEQKK